MHHGIGKNPYPTTFDLEHDILIDCDSSCKNSVSLNSNINSENSLVQKEFQVCRPVESTECVSFPSRIFQVIEELRLRRVRDKENEEKINQLVKEIHSLESKYEDALQQIRNLEQEKDRKVAEVKAGYDGRLKAGEEKCKRQLAALETLEREAKVLRDEIRSLQFTNFSYERQVRDLEHKLQQQNGAMESNLRQMAESESRCHAILKKFANLQDEQSKLASDVGEAIKINKNLYRINRHQNCLAEDYKKELTSARDELVFVKAKLYKQKLDDANYSNRNDSALKTLELELKNCREMNQTLTQRLTSKEMDNQRYLDLLTESQRLLDRHIDSNSRYSLDIDCLRKELSEKTKRSEVLQQEYEGTAKLLESERESHATALNEKLLEIDELKRGLESAVKDHNSIAMSQADLEELNTQWARCNLELTERLAKLQKEQDKPRSEQGIQTEFDPIKSVPSVFQDSENITLKQSSKVQPILEYTPEASSAGKQAAQETGEEIFPAKIPDVKCSGIMPDADDTSCSLDLISSMAHVPSSPILPSLQSMSSSFSLVPSSPNLPPDGNNLPSSLSVPSSLSTWTTPSLSTTPPVTSVSQLPPALALRFFPQIPSPPSAPSQSVSPLLPVPPLTYSQSTLIPPSSASLSTSVQSNHSNRLLPSLKLIPAVPSSLVVSSNSRPSLRTPDKLVATPPTSESACFDSESCVVKTVKRVSFSEDVQISFIDLASSRKKSRMNSLFLDEEANDEQQGSNKIEQSFDQMVQFLAGSDTVQGDIQVLKKG